MEKNSLNKVNQESASTGLNTNMNDMHHPEGGWSYARNAITDSDSGDLGTISNEQSNYLCSQAPYTIIGALYISKDSYLIFSTDDTDSEIGIHNRVGCTYTTLVNDKCLNFSTKNLITGALRSDYRNQKIAYFVDGLNPDRVLNLDDIPYKTINSVVNGVPTEVTTTELDCEKLRADEKMQTPCLKLSRQGIGSLLNGSYQIGLAYAVDGIAVTNFIVTSNIQGIFEHNNSSASLKLTLENVDQNFEEIEIAIIRTVNQNTVVKSAGIFASNVEEIIIDIVNEEAPSIPLSSVIVQNPIYETSDRMFQLNKYLLKTGVKTKFDFNYQPLANNIKVFWSNVVYTSNYYKSYHGNKTTLMRDEVYSFFIRFVYNTGDKSSSYHIPGREANASDLQILASNNPDAKVSLEQGVDANKWRTMDTSIVTVWAGTDIIQDDDADLPNPNVPAGATPLPGSGILSNGQIQREGIPGYYETSNTYPNNRPDVWGALSGQPIRHHKMPSNEWAPHTLVEGDMIGLLGIRLEGVEYPKDNDGNPIPNIVGYEVLVGSREGNRSIVAKGIINNMCTYADPSENTTSGGIYGTDWKLKAFSNFPYNDVRTNAATWFHGFKVGSDTFFDNIFSHSFITPGHPNYVAPIIGGANGDNLPSEDRVFNQEEIFQKNLFTFHSPDTNFKKPFLNTAELKIYGCAFGESSGKFIPSSTHPQHPEVGQFAGNTEVTNRAYQYISHGFYRAQTGDRPPQTNSRLITDSSYLTPNARQDFSNIEVNNILRDTSVILRLDFDIDYTNSIGIYDVSKVPISQPDINRYARVYNDTSNDNSGINGSEYDLYGTTDPDIPVSYEDPNRSLVTVTRPIASWYTALKIPLLNQYGSLQKIKQIAKGCVQDISTDSLSNSEVIFAGDCYVGRYTEKNTFYFFYDWLAGQLDETPFDYSLRSSVLGTSFLTQHEESSGTNQPKFENSNYYNFDCVTPDTYSDQLGVFYLFHSGIRDFFVESEINIDYRDWEEEDSKRHYDDLAFTSLTDIFDEPNIKAGNFYKYDFSLSASKLYSNYISWGSVQSLSYDPLLDGDVYERFTKRLLYSLPQQSEQIKDNWRSFLVNNYKDYSSPITNIKSVSKSGAIILLKHHSPIMFQGVDTLQTTSGTKVTVGDGGLFSSSDQNVVNVENPYEYGACADMRSAINTPGGLFFISQNQGKIFRTANNLEAIGGEGISYWLFKYLPSKLLSQFPNYVNTENPVTGIGCQSIFDSEKNIAYFCKKDFKVKEAYSDIVKYNEEFDYFYFLRVDAQDPTKTREYKIELTNKTYFIDCSFTLSFDVKLNKWIGYHDWHPDLSMAYTKHFATTKGAGIWNHNDNCKSFGNFYNVQYPFEVEFESFSPQVETLKSVQYYMEAYVYSDNCENRHHVLDFNFDEAIVYNSEQVSGLLKLGITPKNDPFTTLAHPIFNNNYIDILYSKEENKYRFNQYSDITRDRGEFSNIRETIWKTEENGYIRNLNDINLNYSKDVLERKKFRHQTNNILLRKNNAGNTKMIVKYLLSKTQISNR